MIAEKVQPPAKRRPAQVDQVDPPRVSALWLAWFGWYTQRFLARHFHSVRVSRLGFPPERSDLPSVVYLNHASWWDPLVCLLLKDRLFRRRAAYAPIDQAMLARYQFFKWLGFFGVEQGTRRGAVQFLENAEAALRSRNSTLFLTPQGRYADVRERPVEFASGLGHLAARLEHAHFVPLAIEYVFWEEKLHEVLVCYGEPVSVRREHEHPWDANYWTSLFESKLTEAQDALADQAQRRNPDDFEILLRGGAGTTRLYDSWRSLKARFSGAEFQKEHGIK
jgi:1-acyl-sn-glycerol-3-phosphate acyltransferase